MNQTPLWTGTARAPRWEFTLLDEADRVIRPLTTVTGGSLEVNANTRLKYSGSLTLADAEGIDFMRHRVKITYNPGIPQLPSLDMAVMLLSSPKQRHTAKGTRWEVGLLSKLVLVDEDCVEESYSLPAEANIIDEARALLLSVGGGHAKINASDITLKTALTWDAGTSKLTIINALLEAAGYWSLAVDGSGIFQLAPYAPPGARPVEFRHRAGSMSIHRDEWDYTRDLASVPNRVVCVSQGTDTEPSLVGVAVNEDPTSPYSYAARGRWVTKVVDNVEAASQKVIDSLAQRALLDAMSPVGKLSVTHAIIPTVVNDVVEFEPAEGRRLRATVQKQSYDFSFDAQCQAQWREIIEV